MAWNYDKGAFDKFELPPGVGLRVGQGTRYSVLMLQTHYLLPDGVAAADLAAQHVTDSTSVTVHLTRRLRAVNVGVFSVGTGDIGVPPAKNDTTASAQLAARVCGPECLQMKIGHDFKRAKNNELRIVVAKLHAHNYAAAITMRHSAPHPSGRGTAYVEDVVVSDPWCGQDDAYDPNDPRGSCQRYIDVSRRGLRPLRPTDSLELHCHFVNPTKNPVMWGRSYGQEMCAGVIYYAPGSVAAYHSEERSWSSTGKLQTCVSIWSWMISSHALVHAALT